MNYLLAIDQGTTSSRAVLFDQAGQQHGMHQISIKQYYPENGWVEHDAEEIWQSTLACCQAVLKKTKISAKDVAAIGISNQRETTILWDKHTGKPVHHAIVWQDRRTADYCHKLSADSSIAKKISEKTGLLLDSYFCATKIRWLIDHVDGLKKRIAQGDILFGTVDSYLLWQLTGGKVHATDATNASRTLLFNIHTQEWDKELLNIFDIPGQLLPTVMDNSARFGKTDARYFKTEIPITGMAGDQHAAMIGQACFKPGTIKSTYGTGCFVMLNTGDKPVKSTHRLLTTLAYRINQKPTYALEGSIFVAGAAIQWLRDNLCFFTSSKETQALAESVESTSGVYFVPAFTGLGAPYWDPNARGAILGLTRDTSIADITRAALEAVCYQTRDLLDAMQQDYQSDIHTLRVDGGMIANDWLLQFLSNILGINVDRPQCIETSALGAAYLAGLGVGLFNSLGDITNQWRLDKTCQPGLILADRNKLYSGWKQSIVGLLSK